MKARLFLIYEKEIKENDRELLEKLLKNKDLNALEQEFNIEYEWPINIMISFEE